MKKTAILLFAITSFFVSFSAFSQDFNYVFYSNSEKCNFGNYQSFYKGFENSIKNDKNFKQYTFSSYDYSKTNSYILSKNADIIVIFIAEQTATLGSYDPTKAFYTQMIQDLKNANPHACIYGAYFGVIQTPFMAGSWDAFASANVRFNLYSDAAMNPGHGLISYDALKADILKLAPTIQSF
ncbi:hypothetical protein P0136_12030 [Lentisphaerota bacterium ZTH]|nr:hypothetical protein JYG24_10460 [Lentisphaerota bacterium]WET06086.1 hypothetical protein P0136_12030 [Lentisphaerota bacterium ZTH]